MLYFFAWREKNIQDHLYQDSKFYIHKDVYFNNCCIYTYINIHTEGKKDFLKYTKISLGYFDKHYFFLLFFSRYSIMNVCYSYNQREKITI